LHVPKLLYAIAGVNKALAVLQIAGVNQALALSKWVSLHRGIKNGTRKRLSLLRFE